MVRLTGHMGVPLIVIDGQAVVGFDRPRLEQLLANGGGQRPRFGLRVADAGRITQKTGGVPIFGALVDSVSPSSLGERAGLRSGDIITEVNLKPIRNADDLEYALAGLSHGNRVTIVFLRGGEKLRSELVI